MASTPRGFERGRRDRSPSLSPAEPFLRFWRRVCSDQAAEGWQDVSPQAVQPSSGGQTARKSAGWHTWSADGGAQHAQLTLTYQGDRVCIDIVDDGQGFDPMEPTGETPDGTGIGLTAIRTRLAEVGGLLTVESAPGSGTAISAIIATDAPDA